MVRDQGNMARAPSLMNYWTAILQHLGRPVIHPRIHMPPCPFVFRCVGNKCTWRHQVFQLICSEICQTVYATNSQMGNAAVSPKKLHRCGIFFTLAIVTQRHLNDVHAFFFTSAPSVCWILPPQRPSFTPPSFICTERHDGGTTLSRLCVLLDARVVQATH